MANTTNLAMLGGELQLSVDGLYGGIIIAGIIKCEITNFALNAEGLKNTEYLSCNIITRVPVNKLRGTQSNLLRLII